MAATTPLSTHMLRSVRWGTAGIYAVALIATMVLSGWALHIEVLKHIAPGMNSMNPLTAVNFELCALALWLLRDEQNVVRRRRARWPAALVLLLGLVKLVDAASGALPEAGGWVPGRMSPNAAACFVMLGLSLLLASRQRQHKWLHLQWPLMPILVITLFAIVGYLYQDQRLYNIKNFTPMSLIAAITFMLATASLLMLRPDSGVMRLITSDSVGGFSARILLSPGILLPVILGRVLLGGQHDSNFDYGANIAVMVVLMVVLQTALVMGNATWLFRLDVQRRRSDRELELRIERERRQVQTAADLAALDATIRSLRGDLDKAPQQVLSQIAGNVQAMQACLYQTSGKAGPRRLRVLAAHAAGSAAQLDQDIGWDEGLAGQCAREAKAVIVTQVPKDYWRIRSGVIDALPNALAFLPVQFDGEVLGVLELASLQGFSEEQMEFLRKAADIVAFALFRLRTVISPSQLRHVGQSA